MNPNKYFHRLIAYIMTIAPYILRKYVSKTINEKISKEVFSEPNLHNYLEQEKHSTFHLFERRPCCQCNEEKEHKSELTHVQFKILYKQNYNSKCVKSLKHKCPCVYVVNPEVTIESLDITLINCIFDHDELSGAKMWINTIKNIRNEIFHLGDPFSIDEVQFNHYWTRLSGSVGGIANLVKYRELLYENEDYVKSFEIKHLSQEQIFNAHTFFNEEYQRKCQNLELKLASRANELVQQLDTSSEKELLQCLFKKIAFLRSTLHDVEVSVRGTSGVKRLMEATDDGIVSNMQTVLLACSLDVPVDWDKDKIADGVEKIIQSHKSYKEGNRKAKIKSATTGELNIVLEIIQRVLKDVEECEFEITKLVSEIIESSNINIRQDESVTLNILGALNVEEKTAEKWMYEYGERPPSYWSIFGSGKTLEQWPMCYAERVNVSSAIRIAVTTIAKETWNPHYTGKGQDLHGTEALSYKSINIIDVKRIENPMLFRKYNKFRENLFRKSDVLKKDFRKLEDIPCGVKRSPIFTTNNTDTTVLTELFPEINEHYLLHGTLPERINEIVTMGFDIRVLFGNAIYATESSRKGDQYADYYDNLSPKTLILLRMALGEIYVIDKEKKFSRPPCKKCFDDRCRDAAHHQNAYGFFDSIVVDGDWNFRKFLSFNSSQCYPEYVITYKTE